MVFKNAKHIIGKIRRIFWSDYIKLGFNIPEFLSLNYCE